MLSETGNSVYVGEGSGHLETSDGTVLSGKGYRPAFPSPQTHQEGREVERSLKGIV